MKYQLRTVEELEITRHNVTPAQFAAYVRSQIRKHNMTICYAGDIDTRYWAAGNDLNFNHHHDGLHEISVSKPYEMQTYIRNEQTGETYNFIMEFSYDDEKTGTGYFYTVQIDADPIEDETETTETAQAAEAAEAAQDATEAAEALPAFVVTFESRPSSGIYCANICRAATAEQAADHYSRHGWHDVRPATAADLAEAQRKGMPVVILPAPTAEAPQEAQTAEAWAAAWMQAATGNAAQPAGQEITVIWKDGRPETTYTTDILEALKTEPTVKWIVDPTTGEILHDNMPNA